MKTNVPRGTFAKSENVPRGTFAVFDAGATILDADSPVFDLRRCRWLYRLSRSIEAVVLPGFKSRQRLFVPRKIMYVDEPGYVPTRVAQAPATVLRATGVEKCPASKIDGKYLAAARPRCISPLASSD